MKNVLALRNPKPDTQFRQYNNLFTLFHRTNGQLEYWREYWREPFRSELIARGQAGDLGEFEQLITRYVPRHLPVLEAGCGPAHYVAALNTRGYQATGLDYEPEVVRFVNNTLPELDVRLGNVLSLEFPAGSLGCYLSLGVVEHFIEGPARALTEARRVLHPEGVALISVPYLNPARQAHFRRLQANGNDKSGLEFHQYYFNFSDFAACLRHAGFKVVDHLPYAVEAFLIREHPLFSRFWKSPLCRGRMKKAMRRLFRSAPLWLRERYGHMLLVVARPLK